MLKKENTYKTKDGVVKQRNAVSMKVCGKEMDKDETRTIVILSKDGIRHSPAGTVYASGGVALYDSYSIFVKDDGDMNEGSGYFMNLSPRSARDLKRLSPKQFDVFKMSKGSVENKKTGGENPIVVWEKVEKEDSSSSFQIAPKPVIVLEKPPVEDFVITNFERELALSLKGAGCNLEQCLFNFNKFKNEGKDVLDISVDRVKKVMNSV
jgi:hypothetical protein